MNWIKLSIPSTPDEIDDLCARLVSIGVESFQIEDERDVQREIQYWDMADEELLEHYKDACRVIVYMPETDVETFELLRNTFLNCIIDTMKEEDWAENWKQYYKPILIGEKLVIHPAWEEITDYGNRAIFLNNPGMSFGTGLHASTRLCLEMLEQSNLHKKRVLDIGCGSGILCISAMLLGAKNALAIDIDPLATDVAKQNAIDNKVALKTITGDFVIDTELRNKVGFGYDVICTNIVADVIIMLAPLINMLLNDDGIWISSGIIDTRENEVLQSFTQYDYKVITKKEEKGWVAFCVNKKK